MIMGGMMSMRINKSTVKAGTVTFAKGRFANARTVSKLRREVRCTNTSSFRQMGLNSLMKPSRMGWLSQKP